jgi:hypothetical protein
MVYELPEGYAPAPVEFNEVLPYQYRVVSHDGQVEIRYVVFPLDRVEIDYDDPHSSAPEPDHLFTLLFPGILTRSRVGAATSPRNTPRTRRCGSFGPTGRRWRCWR